MRLYEPLARVRMVPEGQGGTWGLTSGSVNFGITLERRLASPMAPIVERQVSMLLTVKPRSGDGPELDSTSALGRQSGIRTARNASNALIMLPKYSRRGRQRDHRRRPT